MAMGSLSKSVSQQPDMTTEETAMLDTKIHVDKDALEINPVVIHHIDRLETDEELKRRFEREEEKAAAEKKTKKKPAGKQVK